MNLMKETFSKSLENFGNETVVSGIFCVDRVNSKISYDDFFSKYLSINRPCILGKWATSNWKSVKLWTKISQESLKTVPDFDYLKLNFGLAGVPVADCKQKYYNSQQKETFLFKDYVEYWKTYGENNYPEKDRCLYLKDWHFPRQIKLYEAYETPVYFRSDWLNEFWDKKTDDSDDYRFVYMGPKGSWTPFHADVYRSYSWSANICGKKKWILHPPGNEEYLRDIKGQLPYDITSPMLEDVKAYPNAHKAVKPLIVIQEAGEIIYVPSGWFHQVHNLEDTISINHNWLNACNIGIVWDFLTSEFNLVKNEIQDCRTLMTEKDWLYQCQIIMQANSGIDFHEFVHLLRRIALTRKVLIDQAKNVHFPDTACTIKNVFQQLRVSAENRTLEVSSLNYKGDDQQECYFHALFDLCKILLVLDKFLQNQDVKHLSGDLAVKVEGSMYADAYELFCIIYSSLERLLV